MFYSDILVFLLRYSSSNKNKPVNKIYAIQYPTTGYWYQEYSLTCKNENIIFPKLFFFLATQRGMRDLVPWPGIEPRPLHWERGVLTTGPWGKPLTVLISFHSFFFSMAVISTALSSNSLIRSSASVILLLIPSCVFFTSVIVVFISVFFLLLLFFKSSLC